MTHNCPETFFSSQKIKLPKISPKSPQKEAFSETLTKKFEELKVSFVCLLKVLVQSKSGFVKS